MKVERVNRGASNKLSVVELKGYLNINSTDRDEELTAILNAAICKVEDITGYSLTEQTIRLYVYDKISQYLYFPDVDEVTSVSNLETGSDLNHTVNPAKTKVTFNDVSDALIEYTTIPNDERIYDLKSYVYSYAGVLYDGELDKAEQVLKTIPRNLC